jgi:hypothetical protein
MKFGTKIEFQKTKGTNYLIAKKKQGTKLNFSNVGPNLKLKKNYYFNSICERINNKNAIVNRSHCLVFVN